MMALPWRKIAVVTLCVILVLGIVVPALLIGTGVGSRFLLNTVGEHVEGLSLEEVEARPLWRGLRARTLQWDNAGTRVDVSDIDLSLTWFCESDIVLCIEHANAASINAVVPPSDKPKPEEPEATITLPTIEAPVGLLVRAIGLASVTVATPDSSPWLSDIHWHAKSIRWLNTTVTIEQSDAGNTLWQHQLSGRVDLQGDYPLAFEQTVQASPPQLAGPVKARLSLTNTVADLDLHLITDAPRTVELSAQLQPLAKVIAGNLRIGVDKLDPNTVVELPLTRINGKAEATFSIEPAAGHYHINANAQALEMVYRDVTYVLDSQITTSQNGEMAIEALTLKSPDTRLQLAGQLPPLGEADFASPETAMAWLQRARIDGDFKAAQLSQLTPSLNGSVAGDIAINGQASLVAKLNGNALNLSGTAINSITLNANLPLDFDSEQALTLNAKAQDIQSGDTNISHLTTSLQGRYSAHTLTLRGDSEQFTVNGKLSGGLQSNRRDWAGTLESLSALLQHPVADNTLSLKSPAALAWQSASSRLSLDPACLAVNAAALCTGQAIVSPANTSLDFQLENLSAESLRAWMPENFVWKGSLAGNGKLSKQGEQPPRFSIELTGPPGELTAAGTTPVTQSYERIALKARGEADTFNANLTLDSAPQTPLLDGHVTLSGDNFSTLQGKVSLDNFDIAVIAPTVPEIAELAGEVNINISLAGTTASPVINGVVQLDKGLVRTRSNPTQLDDIRLTGRFDQSTLTLDGEFMLGQGKGTLDGSIALNDTLSGTVHVKGTELELRSPPLAALTSNLDINARFDTNTLTLSGDVAIPRGDITIAELPPSAQSLSSDVRVIKPEEDQKDQASTLAMIMDINASVGPQLHFSGFGASARLSGKLNVTQSPGNPLEGAGAINIVDGRYRGYGQKLNIRRGRLLFNGPIATPSIDLQAIREVEDTIVGINVTGPATTPEIIAFAEPAMANSDALYALVTGKLPDSDSGTDKDALLAQALLSSGLALGGGSVASGAEKLGISNFNIGSGDNSDLQMSGYLRPDLYLEYGVNALGDGSIFKVRWDFAKRVSLEMINSLQSSLDLLYSKSF